MNRREFIKNAIIAGGGICLGAGICGCLNKLSEHAGNESPGSNFTAAESANASESVKTEKLWKWSKEAYHYLKLGNNMKCKLCPNECLIEQGERSTCRNKVNVNGKLYTLAYGNPCSVHVDPIEKKPLFHFLPATKAFSIATAGCNFRCLNCQNWTISQARPEETTNMDLFPDGVVKNALDYECKSIAYTYSEPTAFYEYMYDTSKIARENSIKNLWITNGYINEKPLRELCKYMDAANVDLKSFKDGIYNKLNSGTLEPVLDTLKILKEEGVWFEVTNLVVPTWTDDPDMIEEMCKWLIKNIGPGYPLHFSRFHPMYQLTNLPQTPLKVLEDARKTAVDSGLKYVYIGNVPEKPTEDTYCPGCGKIIVERRGFFVIQNNIEGGKCKFCSEGIAGVWS